MLDFRYVKAGQRIRCEVAEQTAGEFVTVPNVPMVSTGINYPTSTGLITFTEKHLQDLVASQDDPAIHAPRTKIGHSDPRFNGRTAPDGLMLDGEPSLGTWCNLHLGDNGQTVYGDLVGVPKWFAKIVSTAYPSRSIEGNFDVETVTGHKWSLSVDAVAMLGVIGPGVTTLDDLPVLFSEEGPSNVRVLEANEGDPMSVIRSSIGAPVVAETVSDTAWSQFSDSDYDDSQYARACIFDRAKCSDDWKSKPAKERYSLRVREPDGTLNKNGVHAAASRFGSVGNGCDAAKKAAATTLVNLYTNQLKEDPPKNLTDAANAAAASALNASTNLDDVRRSYYEQAGPGQMWWWIRAVYLDPNELIVDDDEGGLFRVPFATDKDGGVTFEDPTPVVIQYVDQPSKKAAASIRASVAASLRPNAVETYKARSETRPGGSMTPEQIAALRSRTGLSPEQLPDDADDSQILRVLSEPVAASAPEPGTPPATTPPAPEAPAAPAPAAIPNTTDAGRAAASTPPSLPDGTIMVDRATWESVAEQARQGAEVAASMRDTERDRYLDDAIVAGKFPPSRREHYLKAWEADPDGTKGLIDTLAVGLVPVSARGTASTGKDTTVAAAEENSYPTGWLTPAERGRIERAAKQDTGEQPPLVTQGGD